MIVMIMAMMIYKKIIVMMTMMMMMMSEITIDKNPLSDIVADLEIFNSFDFCHRAFLREEIIPGIEGGLYCKTLPFHLPDCPIFTVLVVVVDVTINFASIFMYIGLLTLCSIIFISIQTKDKGKDKDKDNVLKRPNMCHILDKQEVQGFQI